MATAGVWNLSSPACLCQGCLPWGLRPCSKIRKLHRGSQSGLLRGLNCLGENFTHHTCLLLRKPCLSVWQPPSPSLPEPPVVLELAHTCLACESWVSNFQALWEPLGFTLAAIMGAFTPNTPNQSPSHHSALLPVVKHLLTCQGPTTLKLKYQAPFSSYALKFLGYFLKIFWGFLPDVLR